MEEWQGGRGWGNGVQGFEGDQGAVFVQRLWLSLLALAQPTHTHTNTTPTLLAVPHNHPHINPTQYLINPSTQSTTHQQRHINTSTQTHSYTGAKFQPQCDGQVSPIGGFCRIGTDAGGLVVSPSQLR